jgi:MFS family permease
VVDPASYCGLFKEALELLYRIKRKDFLSKRKIYSLILLFFLYLSQGLPFGFQATALPVFLRQRGVSLSLIGYSTALALPWMLKFLWAPLIDSFYIDFIGKRKSWILPLQCLLLFSMICAFFSVRWGLLPLVINLLAMNFFAATQDIAVDGLAVDILSESELGSGNIAQVVGYKSGMIISGGVLVALTYYFSWSHLFIFMSLIALLPLVMIIFFREKPSGDLKHFQLRLELKDIFLIFWDSLKTPYFKWLLLFIATYKSGEIIIDVMFKPFLVDRGLSPSDIGLWVGTYGMIASVAGSFFGGCLSSSIGVYRGLLVSAINRLFPLLFISFLSYMSVTAKGYVIASTLLEHFFGGALTTSLFAFMMANCDKRISATHYTALASVEVFGKSPGAIFSGVIAEKLGYFAAFSLGTAISAAVIFILPVYRYSKEKYPGEG